MASSVGVTLNWNSSAIGTIQSNATKGLIRMGYDIASEARRNAPYRTGALVNSIRVEENAGIVEVIAGGNYGSKTIPYAAIQEFGGRAGRNRSVTIVGKHYMKRALDHIMAGDYLTKYFGDITK